MDETYIIYLLIPYTIFLVWILNHFRLSGTATTAMYFTSGIIVWGIIYVFSVSYIEAAKPLVEPQFASIESIMVDVQYFHFKYFFQSNGWLISSAYFAVCWLSVWLYRNKWTLITLAKDKDIQ